MYIKQYDHISQLISSNWCIKKLSFPLYVSRFLSSLDQGQNLLFDNEISLRIWSGSGRWCWWACRIEHYKVRNGFFTSFKCNLELKTISHNNSYMLCFIILIYVETTLFSVHAVDNIGFECHFQNANYFAKFARKVRN